MRVYRRHLPMFAAEDWSADWLTEEVESRWRQSLVPYAAGKPVRPSVSTVGGVVQSAAGTYKEFAQNEYYDRGAGTFSIVPDFAEVRVLALVDFNPTVAGDYGGGAGLRSGDGGVFGARIATDLTTTAPVCNLELPSGHNGALLPAGFLYGRIWVEFRIVGGDVNTWTAEARVWSDGDARPAAAQRAALVDKPQFTPIGATPALIRVRTGNVASLFVWRALDVIGPLTYRGRRPALCRGVVANL